MSRLFPFPPALTKDVKVRVRHQTEVERKKKGGELRASLSSHLMRALDFDYLMVGHEAQRCREFFDDFSNEDVRVPDWACPAKVVSATGSTIQLECHEGIDFRVYSVFLIRHGEESGSEYGLTSYNAGTGEMVIDGAPDLGGFFDWQAYPVRVCKMGKMPQLPERGDDQFTFSLQVEELVESHNPAIDWPKRRSNGQ